jgi:hypothetical protein
MKKSIKNEKDVVNKIVKAGALSESDAKELLESLDDESKEKLVKVLRDDMLRGACHWKCNAANHGQTPEVSLK